MNYKLTISYDGSGFSGWQKQPGRPSLDTIQGRLESVAKILNGNKDTQVNGAGRTDSGVHAFGQVANVVLDSDFDEAYVKDYFNKYIPESIRIEKCEKTPDRFHARLNAKSKKYSYHVYLGAKASVFERKYVYVYEKKLDFDILTNASKKLIGEHDFAGFSTKTQKKKSTIRNLQNVVVNNQNNMLVISFVGDGFLYNQVRIMVGTLLEIACGEKNIDIIDRIFESGDREIAGFTAPGCGLFLDTVYY